MLLGKKKDVLDDIKGEDIAHPISTDRAALAGACCWPSINLSTEASSSNAAMLLPIHSIVVLSRYIESRPSGSTRLPSSAIPPPH